MMQMYGKFEGFPLNTVDASEIRISLFEVDSLSNYSPMVLYIPIQGGDRLAGVLNHQQ